jgi:hypothetical protein
MLSKTELGRIGLALVGWRGILCIDHTLNRRLARRSLCTKEKKNWARLELFFFLHRGKNEVRHSSSATPIQTSPDNTVPFHSTVTIDSLGRFHIRYSTLRTWCALSR